MRVTASLTSSNGLYPGLDAHVEIKHCPFNPQKSRNQVGFLGVNVSIRAHQHREGFGHEESDKLVAWASQGRP